MQERIQRERDRLKTARGEDLLTLRKTLLTLYDMSRDLRDTAYILENYYGGEEK